MSYSKEEKIREAVKNSKSIYGVLRYLGIKCTGGSHYHYKKKIIHLGIDISHFTGSGHNKGKIVSNKKLVWQDVLVNGKLDRRQEHKKLKRAMLEYGFEYKCKKCGCADEWCGEKITLEVNHKNWDWKDNTPENLEFLCPNCHSQYKNPARARKEKIYKKFEGYKLKPEDRIKLEKNIKYCECGKQIRKNCIGCKSCTPRKTKINWPTNEELMKMIWEKPTIKVAKELGVTDNAVLKRCKKFGIDKPPRGYWEKVYHNTAG